MQFSTDGTFYNVMRITGPSHNLLGLKFADNAVSSPSIQMLRKPTGNALQPTEILSEVLAGVASANKQFGTEYVVDVVRFVPDDTPPATIYRHLAAQIVGRLATRGEFEFKRARERA